MTTVIVITDQCVLIISMGMSTTVLKLKSSIGKSVVGYNETSIASHHLYMPFITVLHGISSYSYTPPSRHYVQVQRFWHTEGFALNVCSSCMKAPDFMRYIYLATVASDHRKW